MNVSKTFQIHIDLRQIINISSPSLLFSEQKELWKISFLLCIFLNRISEYPGAQWISRLEITLKHLIKNTLILSDYFSGWPHQHSGFRTDIMWLCFSFVCFSKRDSDDEGGRINLGKGDKACKIAPRPPRCHLLCPRRTHRRLAAPPQCCISQVLAKINCESVLPTCFLLWSINSEIN